MLREHILVRLFSVPVTEDVRSGNKSSLCSWRLLVLVYGDFIWLINGIKTREPIIRTGQSKENLHKPDVDNVHKTSTKIWECPKTYHFSITWLAKCELTILKSNCNKRFGEKTKLVVKCWRCSHNCKRGRFTSWKGRVRNEQNEEKKHVHSAQCVTHNKRAKLLFSIVPLLQICDVLVAVVVVVV